MSIIRLVEDFSNIKTNAITSRYQESGNKGNDYASYRLGFAAYPKKLLDDYLNVVRDLNEDENISLKEAIELWSNGLPYLEMDLNFEENDNISYAAMVYYFDNYETIYELTNEEIEMIKVDVLPFLQKYRDSVPNYDIFNGGDCDFEEVIPTRIIKEWKKII